MVGLNDLDGSKHHVRKKVSNFLNDLIGMGVKGFRVDASKQMWPRDLMKMQNLTMDLPDGGRPFFYHQVIDMGGEAISDEEYHELGRVTEYRFSFKLFTCISNRDYDYCANMYDEVGEQWT